MGHPFLDRPPIDVLREASNRMEGQQLGSRHPRHLTVRPTVRAAPELDHPDLLFVDQRVKQGSANPGLLAKLVTGQEPSVGIHGANSVALKQAHWTTFQLRAHGSKVSLFDTLPQAPGPPIRHCPTEATSPHIRLYRRTQPLSSPTSSLGRHSNATSQKYPSDSVYIDGFMPPLSASTDSDAAMRVMSAMAAMDEAKLSLAVKLLHALTDEK